MAQKGAHQFRDFDDRKVFRSWKKIHPCAHGTETPAARQHGKRADKHRSSLNNLVTESWSASCLDLGQLAKGAISMLRMVYDCCKPASKVLLRLWNTLSSAQRLQFTFMFLDCPGWKWNAFSCQLEMSVTCNTNYQPKMYQKKFSPVSPHNPKDQLCLLPCCI